uniref:Family with sequence similarity 78 member B n=1 Tax=Bos mutus grunniens TaxID=30521 RepID=A0A8B9WDW9_BOSMU
MGCIKALPARRGSGARTSSCTMCATIDQCPTRIEETSPIVLRYKTPYFKASARVVMPPIPRHETWVVGWIQACNQMEFFNTYSDLGMCERGGDWPILVWTPPHRTADATEQPPAEASLQKSPRRKLSPHG